MSRLNPIEKSKYINDKYKEYLKSSFNFEGDYLQELFIDQLDKESLFKGPYVDLNLPFTRGKSVDELIDEGIICKGFSKLGDVNFTRPLYYHQEQAIRKIGNDRSAVITTGTGSGKTESFLYPILNDLLFDVENGNTDVGIRAIFLYPMNALVNDQMDRVRKLLSSCPEITFGFFTGETKETVPANYRKQYGDENGIEIPDNELVSRKEIRENPPHLLFTNYSMLEYLLIRPNDYSLFAADRLNNWKYVVLDEAHSYYGSLGIELSMLMRRLTGLANRKPRFILTSATLGEKGKSENEIVDFARNLTSVNFEVDDIVFSNRIELDATKFQYRINCEDYRSLKENLNDLETVKAICNRYVLIQTVDISSVLYEVLIRDKNVYELYTLLKNESRSFIELKEDLSEGFSDSELIALIDLINLAEVKGIGIFDLKYHSFVRPLSGAYITFGDQSKLSLTKTNKIDGYKAFELGNCRYCNTPYIIGKIQHNNIDELDYLFQNKEVDIYENYGNIEHVSIDYFMLNETVDDDSGNQDNLDEYTLCSKCGCIHLKSNLNAQYCKCGSQYQKSIFRVNNNSNKKTKKLSNNVKKCPSCGHEGRAGVVKSLNVGKDEGTALIAQILMEAIDEGEVEVSKPKKISLKLGQVIDKTKNNDNKKVKQFLSFSDSRQQASFSATFMDATHTRMLQKRLVWSIVEEFGYKDVTVDEAAARLAQEIKEKRLFENDLDAHKNAWVSIMIDLLKVDGAYDSEGLGLYYFDLDIDDLMAHLDDEDIKEEFGQFGIGKSEFKTLIKLCFDVFKTTPAINYTKSGLTQEDRLEYLGYRRFDNYVMLQKQKKDKSKASLNVKSFLPIQGSNNKLVRFVEKVCKCDTETSRQILELIFSQIGIAGEIFRRHDTKEIYQIDVSRYVIKNYKTSSFYKCSKCGRLTPYNIHNICPKDKCEGELSQVDPDEELKSNYYRYQYKTKKIEKIVVKEHTAQLDKKTAKRYQVDFRDKKINILSCSTTFEMGIDIGDLETVYMRNVPPTPANYVQRAGRAGRRKDSAAYILTYCSTGSHDYTYFLEPNKMISGIINPPYFNVQNKKIIVRHLMAVCLGAFFRENKEYFESIHEFVFNNGVGKFKEFMKQQPIQLNEYINKRVLPGREYEPYHDFNWYVSFEGDDEKLKHMVDRIFEIDHEYVEAKEFSLNNEQYKEASYFDSQINSLHKERVLNSLSRYCVIPKYGFPVDLVALQIYKEGKLDNRYDLTRDLKIAISEYAPDSEVIVDGKKYTSKYISIPKSTPLPKHYFAVCSNCMKVNVYSSTNNARECKYCGEAIDSVKTQYFIEAVNGFKTGQTKESSTLKPKRTYSGEISYLGDGSKFEDKLSIGNVIEIETSTDDTLMIMNKKSFYMCQTCGFSEVADDGFLLPSIVKEHKNYREFKCSDENLEQVRLGHRFQTDVARFTIPLISSFEESSHSKALSFLYAFLEGVSKTFGIERNDINGIIELNLEQGSYDILMFDDVPGGAGHVKRLLNKDAIIDSLKAALEKVSQQCCDKETSCYNCLRNYYNQTYHSRLQRQYAIDIIQGLLREICVK